LACDIFFLTKRTDGSTLFDRIAYRLAVNASAAFMLMAGATGRLAGKKISSRLSKIFGDIYHLPGIPICMLIQNPERTFRTVLDTDPLDLVELVRQPSFRINHGHM
jgi:hypothetical protein